MAAIKTFSLAFDLINTIIKPIWLDEQNYENWYIILSFVCTRRISNVAAIQGVQVKPDVLNAYTIPT
jgi:hypothetical protein